MHYFFGAHAQFFLTSKNLRAILCLIKYIETVEAEVKVFMIPQRVREAESRMEVQNIKWAVEGTVKWAQPKVFCNVPVHVSYRRYGSTYEGCDKMVAKQGGTADSKLIRP